MEMWALVADECTRITLKSSPKIRSVVIFRFDPRRREMVAGTRKKERSLMNSD